MRALSRRFAALLLALGIIGGCSGPPLIGVNTDLTRLLQERERLKSGQGAQAVVQLAHVDGELERITETAYKAAREETDSKAKISYYRIAATAAWQRQDPRTVIIATDGSKACNDRNGLTLSPRDCVMLMVIPALAVNDTWAARRGQIQRDAGPPGLPAKYRIAVNDLINSYEELGRAEALAGTTSAPAQLATVIRAQRTTIGKNMSELVDFFSAKRADESDVREIVSICDSIRARLRDAVPAECRHFVSG